MEVYKTWKDLTDAVETALAVGDTGRAETLALRMLDVAETDGGEPETMASALFTMGMVRDKQKKMYLAEQAFHEAVLWDEKAHGKSHPAVADALRSLAMVQIRRGDNHKALAEKHFERAQQIYKAEGLLLRAAEISETRGEICSDFNELSNAADHYVVAEQLAEQVMGRSGYETLRARNSLGLVFKKAEDYSDAFITFMQNTQRYTVDMSEKAKEELAWTWIELGCLSLAWRAWVEASFAFSVAQAMDPTTSTEGRRLVAKIPESWSFEPLQTWRLTHYNEKSRGGHIGHPTYGLYPFSAPCSAHVGDEVEVDLEKDMVRSVSPIRSAELQQKVP